MRLVRYLYDNPELGNEEHKAMAALCARLSAEGFAVTKSYVLPTGFLAAYDSGKPGRTIAFLCEYDALPRVGHGCGHNLIAGIGVAAGAALKSVIDSLGGKVLVIGTPGEENFGGKVAMAEAGAFDGVDAAMMIHPATEYCLGQRLSALIPLKFEFHGKSAHGCRPQQGSSALDAAVLTYTGIQFLRQYMEAGSYIHGVIRDGGTAANVIPDYASMEYYFRAPTLAAAKRLSEKGTACALSAAQASGCACEASEYECVYGDMKLNYALAELLKAKYAELGIADVHPVREEIGGSSDIGAVSYKCPTLHGDVKIADESVAGHSVEMARATLTEAGRQGLLHASCALADLAADLLENDALYQTVRAEFEAD